ISAFINMLAEISRNHGINKVDFYYSVLRAYQEMNDNYFDILEKSVENFRKIFEINKITSPNATLLEDILTNFYSIKTKHFPEQHHEIDNLIAGFSAKNKTLFINPKATEEEKAFVFAREIAFLFLQLKERSFSEPALEVKSFNQILNDYKASYWAAALLINKDILTDRLTYFFASPRWDSHTLLTIMQLFKASPEVFFNRMSGLMTNHFKVNNFLLMVISKNIDLPIYELTKELQFSYLPTTNETKQMEHYCRRWVSLKILDQPISFFQNKNTPICHAQVSIYENLNKNYLMFSMTNFSEINNLKHTSSSIGFEIDDNLKTVINFLNDPLLKTVQVNQTCERCNITDCNERVVPASTLNKNEVIKRKIQVLKSIIE
ncbi:MAG: ImmA/IrrE family metallo-endopeptidase, partial [Pseudarcicella sp.]|nr:ImmA/IrrE family metallo-endopeptidase [Pseudarcicella sp.]